MAALAPHGTWEKVGVDTSMPNPKASWVWTRSSPTPSWESVQIKNSIICVINIIIFIITQSIDIKIIIICVVIILEILNITIYVINIIIFIIINSVNIKNIIIGVINIIIIIIIIIDIINKIITKCEKQLLVILKKLFVL
jgi:hypothetical protein